ncbi:MAG: hypothetical protein U0744_21675 [Gemmataceae bacterium]
MPTPTQDSPIGRRFGYYLFDAILPICFGAAASKISTVAWLATLCVVAYGLAVTTKAFRSTTLALFAIASYGSLTVFVYWVEPFMASTTSALIQGVGIALILKFGFGILDLAFTFFWLLIGIPIRWQLPKEFQDAAAEEAADPDELSYPAQEISSADSVEDDADFVWVVLIGYPLALGALGTLLGLGAALVASAAFPPALSVEQSLEQPSGWRLAVPVYFVLRKKSRQAKAVEQQAVSSQMPEYPPVRRQGK